MLVKLNSDCSSCIFDFHYTCAGLIKACGRKFTTNIFGFFVFLSRKRSRSITIKQPMMFLARALNNVSRITPNIDRQKVLVETLKNPEKLAKTLLRIEFLTACRREKVSPRFIVDALKPVQKIFGDNDHVKSCCETFKNRLLNESISEAFRTKAYMLRQRSRLLDSIKSFLDESRLDYVRCTCSQVFDATIKEHRPRLVQKFKQRLREETSCVKNSSLPGQERVNNLSSLVMSDQGVRPSLKGA